MVNLYFFFILFCVFLFSFYGELQEVCTRFGSLVDKIHMLCLFWRKNVFRSRFPIFWWKKQTEKLRLLWCIDVATEKNVAHQAIRRDEALLLAGGEINEEKDIQSPS